MKYFDPLKYDPGSYITIDGKTYSIDFRLKHATMEEAFGKSFVCGSVYGDKQDRWPNGKRIHTSFITERIAPSLYRARGGSIFFVESWANEPEEAKAL